MVDTPVGAVTPSGYVRPAFSYCLDYRQTNVRAIYGQDLYLGDDCQDGQLEFLNAQNIYDTSGLGQDAYNSFSPAFAQGVALDRLAKINGLRRKRYTFSTVPCRVVGQAGIEIDGGTFTDPAGYVWALPAVILIPDAGQVLVTATCQMPGAIQMAAGALDTANGLGAIGNATRGWQSVNNTAAASPGQPVELDSALRQRQTISTALPSQTLLDGLYGALAAISGVNRLKVYENDEGYTDANGIPGGCIAAVVDGGDPDLIARVIRLKKGPGVNTYGTTVQTVISTSGIPKDIAFFYLTQAGIGYALDVTNLGGFTESIQGQIAASLAAFTNGLAIGEEVRFDQAWSAAKLNDGAGSKTYRLNSLTLGRVGATLASTDVPIAFTEAAMGDATNIAFTVHALS